LRTGRWAGVDSAWNQEKLEVRKMPENGDETHLFLALRAEKALPYGI
jgi:hypothetical protein